NLFKRTPKQHESTGKLAWIGMDMHNHILPGIDDGSPDVAQSLHLIRGLKDLSIQKAIPTPHVMHGVHDNTPATIAEAFNKLKQASAEDGVKLDLVEDTEYISNNQIATLIQDDSLRALTNKHLLIYKSYLAESKSLFQTNNDIQEKVYHPILA